MGDIGCVHGCYHCCAFHRLSYQCLHSCHLGTVVEGCVVASRAVAYSKEYKSKQGLNIQWKGKDRYFSTTFPPF